MMKPEIQLSNGKHFNFETLDCSNLTVEVVAWSLSNLCRFTGHAKRGYSVAQHCVLASLLVDSPYQYDALMHECEEPLLNDISSPLKVHLCSISPEFGEFLQDVKRATRRHFAVQHPLPEKVKFIDLRLLATEQRDLMPAGPAWDLLGDIEPFDFTIIPWTGEMAFQNFMARYNLLTKGRAA